MRGSLGRISLRAAGMALNALTYAIAARHLSATDMGQWALATALTSIAMSLDLGLSSHLRNRLVDRVDEDRAADYRNVFSLCTCVALIYALLVAGGSTLALRLHLPSPQWWTPARQTLTIAMVVGAGLLCVRMPFNLATNAFYSFNEPDNPIFWEVFNFLASFALVALVLWTGGGVILAAAAFLAGGTLSAIGCTTHFLIRRGWKLRLQAPRAVGTLLAGASSFGFVQLTALGLNTLPSFVVASLVRVEDVTIARAAMILSQAVLSLHLAHAMPIWTEFTQLRTSVDWQVRIAHLRRQLWRESGLLVAAFAVLATLLPWAIGVWLNRAADARVTTAFCAWGAASGLANLHSLILNGANRPLVTATALLPGTALAAGLAWTLAPHWGTAGVAAAFAAGASVTALLMAWFARRQITLLQEDLKR